MAAPANNRHIDITVRIPLADDCRQVHLPHLTDLKTKLQTTTQVHLEGVHPTPYKIKSVEITGYYTATEYEF